MFRGKRSASITDKAQGEKDTWKWTGSRPIFRVNQSPDSFRTVLTTDNTCRYLKNRQANIVAASSAKPRDDKQELGTLQKLLAREEYGESFAGDAQGSASRQRNGKGSQTFARPPGAQRRTGGNSTSVVRLVRPNTPWHSYLAAPAQAAVRWAAKGEAPGVCGTHCCAFFVGPIRAWQPCMRYCQECCLPAGPPPLQHCPGKAYFPPASSSFQSPLAIFTSTRARSS